MLLWLPSTASPRSGGSFDEDEKAAKLHRRARARFMNMLLLSGFLLTVASVGIVKLNHSPKTRGAIRLVERAFQQLPQNSIYRLSVEDPNGAMVSLEEFTGKVTLVVNTACKWGKTKVDFTELAKLQEQYKDQGFSVLAFPTNDFRQEFDTNEEIQSFLEDKFPQVDFPIFGVSELDENPIYQQLHKQLPNQPVKHNFFKYLVDRKGIATHLFTKKQDPLTLTPYIEHLLAKDLQ